MTLRNLSPCLLLALLVANPARARPVELEVLLAVAPEGQGNPAASGAWKSLVAKSGGPEIPALLEAMDSANPLAANWIRAAVLTIADQENRGGRTLPPELLRAYLGKPQHGAAGRILAADLLQQYHRGAWETLVPEFLEDPVPALRREPVGRLITAATASKDRAQLRKALLAARDEDQIRAAADELRALGETVDLPRHFGFLMDWQVLGPFDNKGREGYARSYPPELKIDLTDGYFGKEIQPGKDPVIHWKPWTSQDEFGVVDLNKPLGMLKEVTGYATTTFHSPEARPAEIRLGCKNAWKLWFNGQPVFGRDEYHRGMKIDQYRFPVQLKAGPNVLLMKVCQNEQTETWTVQWDFQLRICDATGTAILDPARPPTPPAALKGKS